MKTLVVYYSLTGKTNVVAQALAKELGADVRRVEDVAKPSVTWWFIITAAISARRGVESEIKPIDTDVRGYDRILVGSPVWGGSPSTPINAFIAQADFSGKDVVPFMTMGGNDASDALKKLSERIQKRGGKIVGSFAFSSKNATDEELTARAREMAQRLR
jgi:flavodoxin